MGDSHPDSLIILGGWDTGPRPGLSARATDTPAATIPEGVWIIRWAPPANEVWQFRRGDRFIFISNIAAGPAQKSAGSYMVGKRLRGGSPYISEIVGAGQVDTLANQLAADHQNFLSKTFYVFPGEEFELRLDPGGTADDENGLLNNIQFQFYRKTVTPAQLQRMYAKHGGGKVF